VPDRIVVIGAGQAGASLAAKLRDTGHDGPITLIGAEPVPPYQRPPLSKKYLLGQMQRERLYLRPESFYADANITLRTGTPARAIDRAAREIVLDDERVGYDLLALTTGAKPRRLPAESGGQLAGVHTVRDLADIDALAPAICPRGRVLIVGGGYIGLEAAAVCAQRGMETTVIELAPRILNRVAAAETADLVRALHESHGVRILEGVGLTKLDGTDRIAAAILSTGERLEVDCVIAGIGIQPETRLAEAAGIEIDNGVKTDSHCRTSDPLIFAAGDCASFPYRGGRIRLESVQNAIDQAEHAAMAMLGSTAPYTPFPWFWSDQYDAKLQIAGLSMGYDRIVTRPGQRAGGHSVWYFSGDTLLAVDAINDPKAYMQGKRWIEQGFSPDVNALVEPDRDLRSLADMAPAGGPAPP